MRDGCMNHCDKRNNDSDRKRMADGNWRQSSPYGRPLTFLQSESHGKEPAHSRIDTVKGAQPKQRQPRPRFAHG